MPSHERQLELDDRFVILQATLTCSGEYRMRQFEDREDLIREATALHPRLELSWDGCPAPVVAGFRSEAASFYFGAEPVYHFNSAGELRRAYWQGKLIKAERGNLVELSRIPQESRTVLLRSELSSDALQALLGEAEQRLGELSRLVSRNELQVLREVSTEENSLDRLGRWLQRFSGPCTVARTPHLR